MKKVYIIFNILFKKLTDLSEKLWSFYGYGYIFEGNDYPQELIIKNSAGRVIRDSRPVLIGWKWRHHAIKSLIAATSVGFEQWK